jgi:hypothetical protein
MLFNEIKLFALYKYIRRIQIKIFSLYFTTLKNTDLRTDWNSVSDIGNFHSTLTYYCDVILAILTISASFNFVSCIVL